MDRQTNSNGFETFLEHWGFWVAGVILVATTNLLTFLLFLRGTWNWLVIGAFGMMLVGFAMIAWAKIPVYRSGRFCTVGFRSVPPERRSHYYWGWCVFLIGVSLGFGLLITRS